MLSLKNVLMTGLLFIAILLSAWSFMALHPNHVSATHDDPTEIDSYMDDVTALTFNKEGGPAMRLVTPKMVHYPENNTTNVTTPRLTIYRNSPQPWYIDADFAKATDGMNQILFWSRVVIHHPSDIENPTTSLETNTLTIFPERQVATTSDPVTFIQPDTIVHGVGMLADLNVGTVKLLAEAKGEYEPTS